MSLVDYLSSKLHIPPSIVMSFINSAPHCYKHYSIPKRNGKGVRLISQPTPELKAMQLISLAYIEKSLPIHPAAMAYRCGISIKENALKHLDSRYLLKMDFAEFFSSIKSEDLILHLEKYLQSYNESERTTYSKLFFCYARDSKVLQLSVGAPSSPLLSNTVLFEFDTIMQSICEEQEITYTRYADDLTFTTNQKNTLFTIPQRVIEVCENLVYPRLTVNPLKTVFSSKKNNRHVTGLTLTNDNKISLGRERKRKIRSAIYRYSSNLLTDVEIQTLAGHLSFARHIEPAFYLSLLRKYGRPTIKRIKEFQSGSPVKPPVDSEANK